MSPELRTLAKEAPALGTAQRVQLAAVRIDSVEGPADLDWETAWVAGLDRRLANTERTGGARTAMGEDARPPAVEAGRPVNSPNHPMNGIPKKIVTDEQNRPVAVQIDYADWLEIERRLAVAEGGKPAPGLERFAGALRLSEDPLEYQQRVRGEWG